MSDINNKQPVNPAVAQQEQFFPPPPGPPPPAAAHPPPAAAHPSPQAPPYPPRPQVPHHPDETPIPEYDIPLYDPAQANDIYSATPTGEHPPQFPSPGNNGAGTPKASWGSKLAGWGSKAAAPLNSLANKIGAEAFLPTTLDKEVEKAARILKSFCKDGIYSDAAPPTPPAQATGPTEPPNTSFPSPPTTATEKASSDVAKGKKPRVLLTIPSKVIARAQGLAIFTTVRAGFHVAGASGSGILVARLPDGSWSPPSGIQVHSIGAGFVIGLDIYDCVVVINSREALEAFTSTRMSLGSDLAVTAGPWGAGGAMDWGVPQKSKTAAAGGDVAPADGSNNKENPTVFAQPPTQPEVTTGLNTAPAPIVSSSDPTRPPGSTEGSKLRKPSPFREALKKPVYSYVKSRGFYAGVQIDGTVVTERKEANAAFYGAPVSVANILKGEIPASSPAGAWPAATRGLYDVLKGAEGWHGQSGHAGQHAPGVNVGPGVATGPGVVGASGVSGATAGMRDLHVGGGGSSSSSSNAGPSAAHDTAPPSAAANAKAAEAATEAAHAEPLSAAPPAYSEPMHGGELPPAYVDDGVPRPGNPDSKTGQH
ncbi:hypothetical protein B0T24DRAFT_551276 [Lasiosphaeria ovina]|uniref:Ysc84 actin-binding domain-containing protein n=1 Tax=Lasiosphaeria ovina TaxID=92902 RepID=A0AAE0MXW0_9PEZI|nr:hypothetical protein B0T24DRAFT_671999 [Lasiosphaeria ovina]KAK3377168.1 hypothetical protein B0T24DRAFT_551276 [Lasiosphaeria ovina]